MYFGYISSHIVLEDLVSEVNGNKTKKQFIIDCIVYFLSKLIFSNNQENKVMMSKTQLHLLN